MPNLTGPWDAPLVDDDFNLPLPVPQGRALALSGGGLRATLFHLGVVERLYVLGALDKLAYLTSVSGGSILAGLLAIEWNKLSGTHSLAGTLDRPARMTHDPRVIRRQGYSLRERVSTPRASTRCVFLRRKRTDATRS